MSLTQVCALNLKRGAWSERSSARNNHHSSCFEKCLASSAMSLIRSETVLFDEGIVFSFFFAFPPQHCPNHIRGRQQFEIVIPVFSAL